MQMLLFKLLKMRINRIRLEFKEVLKPGRNLRHGCINRIRLEFKEVCIDGSVCCQIGINRIRLEFKGYMAAMLKGSQEVLIESDWNLKTVVSRAINRAIQKY